MGLQTIAPRRRRLDGRWHITGSTGTLGGPRAPAAARRGADRDGIGHRRLATHGRREQFGTMTKPFHPGPGARAGLNSALLAKYGYRRARRRSKRHAAMRTSCPPNTAGTKSRRRDAGARQGVKAEEVEHVEFRVHPLALELIGKEGTAGWVARKIQRLPRLRGGPNLRPRSLSRIR
jgi:hypothetical protein